MSLAEPPAVLVTTLGAEAPVSVILPIWPILLPILTIYQGGGMSDFYLVIVDTTGIQSYIFGSNRLRENVGASYLVHMATGGWLMEESDTLLPPGQHNIEATPTARKRLDRRIEADDSLMAEMLYSGGGNSVLIFRREEEAKSFGRKLSSRLIEQAPGLDAVMVIQPFDWTKNLAATMQEMGRQKGERSRSQLLLGLGVTAACASTGLAANYHETEPGTAQEEERSRLSISAEVAAKWDNNKAAKERLEDELPIPKEYSYTYPDEFDDLGRTEGEQSYIGVVHANGNGMGQILEGITEKFVQKSPPLNREYIGELRRFSDKANNVGLKALQAVIDKIAEWNEKFDKKPKELPPPGQMALRPESNKEKGKPAYISILPIVFGGEDVTFVCDGRIVLQAAKVFLDAFSKETRPGAK